jgi:zinc D-Ala-D-Ala carboxypeptidase
VNLSENFTLAEAIRSQEATRRGIDNRPPAAIVERMRETAAMMERIRAFLTVRAGRQVPIRVSSWFRCLPLNRAIGSGDSSDHINGDAVDWEAPLIGSPYEVARMLAPAVDELGIGQLINEFPDRDGWIHTSRRHPAKVVNRIITIKASGTFVGIVP